MALWSQKKRKRALGPARDGPAAKRFRAPAEWQGLLEELGAQQERRKRVDRKRKRKAKQRHIDDYRELRLDGAKAEDVSQALLELTAASYANRGRLGDEDKPALQLRAKDLAKLKDDADVRRTADQAAARYRRWMKKQRIPEPEHYYKASERRETGEIERTYQLPDGKER